MLVARKRDSMVIIEKQEIGTENWSEFKTYSSYREALEGLIELINSEEIDDMTFYYRVGEHSL